MSTIDWTSDQSLVFVNPKLPHVALPSDWERYKDYPCHIWIATSGTTQSTEGAIKWVAASKQAFLASAEEVNTHLSSTSKDIWLNVLPLFHVGGLSIYARAHLSGAKIFTEPKWCKDAFIKRLHETKATLCSLVPAQIYDLVNANHMAPPHLRGVIIGGGAFPYELFKKAQELNWPVMPSFGMSECCSQVATAHLGEYNLSILPHIQTSISPEGFLQIKSPALFSGYLRIQGNNFHWEDPKVDGLFTTQDRVEIKDSLLKFLGRNSDWIKIGGENVSLFHLETFLNKIKPQGIDAVLNPALDPRLGKIIELVALKKQADQIDSLVQQFNAGVMPYEKIRNIKYVESIPRSSLGKVIKTQL